MNLANAIWCFIYNSIPADVHPARWRAAIKYITREFPHLVQ